METEDGGYEGFLVEVLDNLATKLNFQYEMYVPKDGQYGQQNNIDGSWSGMIGELVNDVRKDSSYFKRWQCMERAHIYLEHLKYANSAT